jgi:hypothetical protein
VNRGPAFSHVPSSNVYTAVEKRKLKAVNTHSQTHTQGVCICI